MGWWGEGQEVTQFIIISDKQNEENFEWRDAPAHTWIWKQTEVTDLGFPIVHLQCKTTQYTVIHSSSYSDAHSTCKQINKTHNSYRWESGDNEAEIKGRNVWGNGSEWEAAVCASGL